MQVSTFDVAVLGAGPAGSATAALLALRGLRVVLLERERFPRFHIGESLAPHVTPVLSALGLAESLSAKYLAKHAVRFLCCRTGRQQRYGYDEASDATHTVAWQVPRADFDAMLLDRATALGVTVKQPYAVEDVLFEGGRASSVRGRHADGTREGFSARAVVDATGRDALISTRVGRKNPIAGLDRTALFAHFQRVPRQSGREEGTLDIITFPHGWIWNLPLRGEVNSVGAVVSPAWIRARRSGEALERFFERTVDDAPIAREMLSAASRITPLQAASSLAYAPDHRAGNGWLSVGDAAGFIDPLFCSGTTLALRGAALAADAVADALAQNDVSAARFSDYTRALSHASDLYLAVTRAMYSGDLGDALFEARTRAARSPFAAVLAGDVFGPDPAWRAPLREHPPR